MIVIIIAFDHRSIKPNMALSTTQLLQNQV